MNDFDSMKEMGKMDVFQGRNQIELINEERGITGWQFFERSAVHFKMLYTTSWEDFKSYGIF